jgi:DNA-binding FadR family transcriptional regulator
MFHIHKRHPWHTPVGSTPQQEGFVVSTGGSGATHLEQASDTDGYRPGYEIAAERILEYLVAEQLAPGARLPTEKDLAAALRLSKTVVREAIKILSALGRLSVQKGRGIYVAEPSDPLWQLSLSRFLPTDLDQIYQLFEFRTCVETETSRLAAERATPGQLKSLRDAVRLGVEAAASGDVAAFATADEAFHRGIGVAARNLFLSANIDAIQRLHRQTTLIGLGGLPAGSLVAAAEQHQAIATAIGEGDRDLAASLMSDHIAMTLQQLQGGIRERLFSDPT